MSDSYWVAKESIELPIKAIRIHGIPDEYFREFESEGDPFLNTLYTVYLMASLSGDKLYIGIEVSSGRSSLSDAFHLFMDAGTRETNGAGRFKPGDVPIEEIRWQFIPVDNQSPSSP